VAQTGARTGRLRATWRALLRELGAFGAVGVICFAIDVGLFQLLYSSGSGAVTAKLVSTTVSTTAAYVGHRFWSFAHRERTGYRREYAVFVLVNVVTLLLGLALVAFVHYSLGQDSALVLQATNVVSIGLGTVIRWFSYRRWVFPAKTEAATAPAPGPSSAPPSVPPSVPSPGAVHPRAHTGHLVSGADPASSGA
jgi:putative flippase GtrA